MEKRSQQQPDNNGHNSVIHLISEILDKMIDTQSANIQSTTQMRDSILQSIKLLEEVNKHFTNGFRSDIKGHITEEVEALSEKIERMVAALNVRLDDLEQGGEVPEKNQQLINKLLEEVKSLRDLLENPWYWAKVIAAVLGSLAVIIGGLLRFYQVVYG